jgi:hypothetical protein
MNPEAALARSVTGVPLSYEAEQLLPQLAIPPSSELTVPLPLTVTLRVKDCRSKVAVTDCAALIVTVHGPVPLHAPLHPVKLDPEAALARSVTGVPLS